MKKPILIFAGVCLAVAAALFILPKTQRAPRRGLVMKRYPVVNIRLQGMGPGRGVTASIKVLDGTDTIVFNMSLEDMQRNGIKGRDTINVLKEFEVEE